MFPRRNDSVTGRGVYIQTFESYNQAEKEATRAPTDLLDLATIMALTAILNQIEAQRDHGYSILRSKGYLLGWRSTADLGPVRKCVETRGEGKLLLAGAVRIDQNELELTASPHTPVEHDLLAIG